MEEHFIINLSHNIDKVPDMLKEVIVPISFAEMNNVETRNKVLEEIKKFLNNNLKFNIRVQCDERNNTPQIIDANQLVVDIGIEFGHYKWQS